MKGHFFYKILMAWFMVVFLCVMGFSAYTYADTSVVLQVDSIATINSPDKKLVVGGDYSQGFHFRFYLTVPEAEKSISLRLNDWKSSKDTLPIGGYTRFAISTNGYAHYLGTQGNAQPVRNDYAHSWNIEHTNDADRDKPGKQIAIDVFYKIPANAKGGAYDTQYYILSSNTASNQIVADVVFDTEVVTKNTAETAVEFSQSAISSGEFSNFISDFTIRQAQSHQGDEYVDGLIILPQAGFQIENPPADGGRLVVTAPYLQSETTSQLGPNGETLHHIIEVNVVMYKDGNDEGTKVSLTPKEPGTYFTIRVKVPDVNGTQIPVFRKNSEGSGWEKNSPDEVCTVVDGYCTIRTDHLSWFAFLSKSDKDIVDAFKTAHTNALNLDVETVAVAHADAIQEALAAYETLTATQKALLAVQKDLLDALAVQIFKNTHETVLKLTESTVKLSDKQAVNQASFDRGLLSVAQQSLLEAEKTLLEKLTEQINQLETANEADAIVVSDFKTTHKEALELSTSSVTVGETRVEAALEAYNNLTDAQKNLLADEKEHLDVLAQKITSLQEETEADTRVVKAFKDKHNLLIQESVSSVQIDQKQAINSALEEYNTLTPTQQGLLLDVQQHFGELLAKINQLETANEADAIVVSDFKTTHKEALELSTSSVTVGETRVEAALEAYNNLTDAQKNLLADEKEHLDRLIGEIFKKQHQNILTKDITTIALTDEDAIVQAKTDYENLTDAQKQYLETEKSLLIDLETALAKLQGNDDIIKNFKEKHQGILAISVEEITPSHSGAVSEALAEYAQLSDVVKAELLKEKDHLELLQIRIDALSALTDEDREIVATFKTTHDEAIHFAKEEISSMAEVDLQEAITKVTGALEAYNNLSEAQKTLLDAEYSHFNDLIGEIFKTQHQEILAIESSNVTLNDKEKLNAALVAYEALTDIQKNILSEEKALLDKQKTTILNIEDSANAQKRQDDDAVWDFLHDNANISKNFYVFQDIVETIALFASSYDFNNLQWDKSTLTVKPHFSRNGNTTYETTFQNIFMENEMYTQMLQKNIPATKVNLEQMKADYEKIAMYNPDPSIGDYISEQESLLKNREVDDAVLGDLQTNVEFLHEQYMDHTGALEALRTQAPNDTYAHVTGDWKREGTVDILSIFNHKQVLMEFAFVNIIGSIQDAIIDSMLPYVHIDKKVEYSQKNWEALLQIKNKNEDMIRGLTNKEEILGKKDVILAELRAVPTISGTADDIVQFGIDDVFIHATYSNEQDVRDVIIALSENAYTDGMITINPVNSMVIVTPFVGNQIKKIFSNIFTITYKDVLDLTIDTVRISDEGRVIEAQNAYNTLSIPSKEKLSPATISKFTTGTSLADRIILLKDDATVHDWLQVDSNKTAVYATKDEVVSAIKALGNKTYTDTQFNWNENTLTITSHAGNVSDYVFPHITEILKNTDDATVHDWLQVDSNKTAVYATKDEVVSAIKALGNKTYTDTQFNWNENTLTITSHAGNTSDYVFSEIFTEKHADTLRITVDVVVADDQEKITAALGMWGSLTQKQRESVVQEKENLDTIQAKINLITGVKAFTDSHKETYENIVTPLTLENVDDKKDAIESMYITYVGLPPDTKSAIVSDDQQKIESLWTYFANLTIAKKFNTTHADILAKTQETIAPADQTNLTEATTAYNNLTEVQKNILNKDTFLMGLQNKINEHITNTFIATHADILAKTQETIAPADQTNLTEAIATYDALTFTQKYALRDKHAKLQLLQKELLAKGEANTFIATHADILAKTPETITREYTTQLTEAIAAYNSSSGVAQVLLNKEYNRLLQLKFQISRFETDDALVRTKSETESATSTSFTTDSTTQEGAKAKVKSLTLYNTLQDSAFSWQDSQKLAITLHDATEVVFTFTNIQNP